MLISGDFTIYQCQVSVFTPGMQFKTTKVLAFLAGEYGEVLDGEPMSLGAIEGLPSGLPIIPLVLTNVSGTIRVQVGRDRIDVIRTEDSTYDETESFVSWAVALILNYLNFSKATAGRVAMVIHRASLSSEPAKELSRHFCQEHWTETALRRPQSFELHSHKVFRLADQFEINSWVRFKTGAKKNLQGEAPESPNGILVEQDLNTLAEQMETRELSEPQIRQFFALALPEMNKVLDLYVTP